MMPRSSRVLLSTLLVASAASVHAAKPPVDIDFPPTSSSTNVLQDNFIGLSFELSSFDLLWGKTPNSLPPAMQNYLSNIRARMTNPLRVRIGGNGMDGSKYVADQREMLVFTDPNAYFNDVPVNFGPALFDVCNAMADAVGEMAFSIGLSMRFVDDFENVVDLAAATREKLRGPRLDAMLLGNEPDLYAGHGERDTYTIEDYIPELAQVIDMMTDSPYGNLLNTTILAGPTICCGWELHEILEAGMQDFDYKYYTLQRYPNHACGGLSDRSSNITYYLTHENVAPFLLWNGRGMEIARDLGVPVVLSEYNSVACGGDPNVSPTFATTLWAIDVAFMAAHVNYTGVFLHSREYGVTYNLFDPPNIHGASLADTTDGNDAPTTTAYYEWPPRGSAADMLAEEGQLRPLQPDWRTGAPYYATLVVAEAMSSNTSTVVELDLAALNLTDAETAAAYAIYDAGRRSKLVLLNFDYPRVDPALDPDGDNDASRTFRLPSNLSESHTLGVRYLVAPNVTSHREISWAGQRVGLNGMLDGEQETHTVRCPDGSGAEGCTLEVTVPGPGVALVWLDPESPLAGIYFGNSTIKGLDEGSGNGAESARAWMGRVVTVVYALLMGLVLMCL